MSKSNPRVLQLLLRYVIDDGQWWLRDSSFFQKISSRARQASTRIFLECEEIIVISSYFKASENASGPIAEIGVVASERGPWVLGGDDGEEVQVRANTWGS